MDVGILFLLNATILFIFGNHLCICRAEPYYNIHSASKNVLWKAQERILVQLVRAEVLMLLQIKPRVMKLASEVVHTFCVGDKVQRDEKVMCAQRTMEEIVNNGELFQ